MDKPLIMVVDDEKDFADSIAGILRQTEKYEVVVAYSGKEGLDILAKNKIFLGIRGNRIKLIFLDIKMPEMDGLQFLAKMRQDFGADIGVSMLTAYEDEEKWDKATDGFVINYIKKPLEPEELLATAEKYFLGKEPDMVLNTFEKHIAKREEFKKQPENKQ